MSIASEITRLQNAKSAIKTSIENKGVQVPSATKLDGYAALINDISTGGSNPIEVNGIATATYEAGKFYKDTATGIYYIGGKSLRLTKTDYPNSITFMCGCYANGTFYLGTSGGRLYYSNDGTSFENYIQVASGSMNSICYANGRFVCVFGNGNSYYSTDGTTWTAMTGTTGTLNSVCYGNGRFVCCGQSSSSTAIAFYSTDGTTWTDMTVSGGSYSGLMSVIYANNIFVFGGNKISVYYSTDGTTLRKVSFSQYGSSYFYKVVFFNDRFAAFDSGGDIFTSTDGITWSHYGFVPNRSVIRGAIINQQGKLICSGSKYSIMSTEDLVNWDIHTDQSVLGQSYSVNIVLEGNNKLVFGGNYITYYGSSSFVNSFNSINQTGLNNVIVS